MLPDLGGGLGEFFFIAVLALIVVGPRDLPKVLYTLGQWAGKAQRVTSEFRAGLRAVVQLEEERRHSEEIEKTTSAEPHEPRPLETPRTPPE